MAKKMLLLIAILVVAAQAAAAEKMLSPAAYKSFDDLKLQEVVDAVVAAAPPAKQPEVRRAALAHLRMVEMAFAKAKEAGDVKKRVHLVFSLEAAPNRVEVAPPEDKLKAMEDAFNAAVAPDPMDCPAAGKSFCEMHEKIQKAYTQVYTAVPRNKRLEVQEAVLKKIIRPLVSTINKAYAGGDEKKFERLVAAYALAADTVIATPPAEKLQVMEGGFEAATKSEVE